MTFVTTPDGDLESVWFKNPYLTNQAVGVFEAGKDRSSEHVICITSRGLVESGPDAKVLARLREENPCNGCSWKTFSLCDSCIRSEGEDGNDAGAVDAEYGLSRE